MNTIAKKITHIMGITDVRDNLKDAVEHVENTNQAVTITYRNRARAVLMGAEEYESWKETLDIMSRPELVKGIEEGLKDIREGRYSTFEEVFGQTPAQAVAEGSKIKYGKKQPKIK
jgi:antitoxin YefM